MSELKPCPNPWCFAISGPTIVSGQQGWWVACSCGVRSPRERTDAEAVAAWNRRSERPSPPMAEDLERLVVKLQDQIEAAVATGGRDQISPNDVADAIDALQALSSLAGWRPMATAPQDRLIEFYAPPAHGLDALVGLVSWHPDGGFCVCELREPTHWRPHHPPGAA